MSTAEQQRRWRAQHGAKTGQIGRPATQPCGTVAAAKRHRRRGEPLCGPCRQALAEYQREMYQRRKA